MMLEFMGEVSPDDIAGNQERGEILWTKNKARAQGLRPGLQVIQSHRYLLLLAVRSGSVRSDQTLVVAVLAGCSDLTRTSPGAVFQRRGCSVVIDQAERVI